MLLEHVVKTYKFLPVLLVASAVCTKYIFISRLFLIAPQLLELFTFKDEAEDKGLRKHGLQVMNSIDGAIGLLNEPELLEETLIELGIIHNMKSVNIESFGVSSII